MTDRSGVDAIDLAILQVFDTPATRRPGRYATCSRALSRIEAATGLGPRYAYDALLDLARFWVINVPLVYALGDAGDRDYPAGEAQYVGCHPSRVGQLVLDAEAGQAPPNAPAAAMRPGPGRRPKPQIIIHCGSVFPRSAAPAQAGLRSCWRRRRATCGDIPPAELEAAHHRHGSRISEAAFTPT